MRFVFDTNVLISALLLPTSKPRQALDQALRTGELLVQHRGRPYRVLFAFDPRRVAILLIGGGKTGQGRWYKEVVPVADRLYDQHLAALRKEGLLDG